MSTCPLSLSYPCLKSVIKDLEIGKRKPLAKQSLQFRSIDSQFGVYRVNCLKFVLKKGSDNAFLSIDSVKWVFEKKDGFVVVKCSLEPEKVVEHRDLRAAWKYFQHFMNSERYQIGKLELVGCEDPFRDLTRFNVPYLKWTLDRGAFQANWSASSLVNHHFQKLELRNMHCLLFFDEGYIRNAQKLIISHQEEKTSPYNNNFQVNSEPIPILSSYRGLQNSHLEVTMHLSQMQSFIEIIRNLLQNPHGIGSFYKATYKQAAFSQGFLWEILEKLFDAKQMMVDLNECMTVSDPQNHREINTFVLFKQRGVGGSVALTNTTYKAIIMPENTAIPYDENLRRDRCDESIFN